MSSSLKPAGPNQIPIDVWLIRYEGRLQRRPVKIQALLLKSKRSGLNYAVWQTSPYVKPQRSQIGKSCFLTEDAAKRALIGELQRLQFKARDQLARFGSRGPVAGYLYNQAEWSERRLIGLVDGKVEQIPKVWYTKRNPTK